MPVLEILSGFDLNNAKLQEIKMTVALFVKKRFIVTSNSSRSSGNSDA